MKLEETSESFIHFRVRTFIGLVGGLVIGTNVVNSVLHSIAENEKTIMYNEQAENRRRSHLEEKIEYKITIKDLEKELKNCKDDNK